ncbi:MAG: thioesterase family protein [Clostridiaceae bacterium]
MLTGLTGYSESTVTEKDTAQFLGSGNLPVYGTPAMIAFIELTACESISGHLNEGETTVGIRIDAQHLKASKVGTKLVCKTVVTNDDGKVVDFEATVYADDELIGSANHKRARVKSEKFLARLGISK